MSVDENELDLAVQTILSDVETSERLMDELASANVTLREDHSRLEELERCLCEKITYADAADKSINALREIEAELR